MLSGIEYASSDEKRSFDLRVVRLIRPFALVAKQVLLHHGAVDVEFTQSRIGRDNIPFEAYKLRTLKDDELTPI